MSNDKSRQYCFDISTIMVVARRQTDDNGTVDYEITVTIIDILPLCFVYYYTFNQDKFERLTKISC